MLASKLAAKIPMDVILDNVKDSVVNSEMERIHLLTKQDLRNIERSYNLNNSAILDENDAESVDLWAKKLKDNRCCLYYKPQNELSTQYCFLKEEDFVLIIMNEGQLEMLLEYSSDCICVDGKYGINGYGFQLHTLMVLDNMRKGFPCAFLITNRSDEHVFTLFFSLIKEEYTSAITSKVFMSDMAESYYKAWVKVMGSVDLCLYCTWHVDQAWRKNLNKINSKEKQVSVYKKLRVLLHETDKTAFTTMIQQFMNDIMDDDDTKIFAKYFQTWYVSKVSAWAYCYRLYAGLNTNTHLERMHRTIKYLYLNGKQTKRFDICIYALLKFVRDKLFNIIWINDKDKVTTKLKCIRNRHKISEELDVKSVLPNESGGFDVVSESNEIYSINYIKSCKCDFLCKECNICIHVYTCTCIDYAVRWNMCKHIHLVQRYKKTYPECCTANALSSDEENEEEINRISNIVDSGTKKKEVDLDVGVDLLKRNFLDLVDKIDSVERLEHINKHIDLCLASFQSSNEPKEEFCGSSTSTKKRKLNASETARRS